MNSEYDPKVIGGLLALVAHDLRNSLSALQSNLGFVQSMMGSEVAELIEAIEDGLVSCEGLGYIVDNLDLFGQALRGAAHPAPGTTDLATIVLQSADRSSMAAKSHAVIVQIDPQSPPAGPYVAAIPELLLRALSNLVRNAIQHAGSGGWVRVSYFAREGEGVVRVEDPGPAIAPDLREAAFTASGQLSAKNANNGRYSRGLGLFCAHLAASACGATIAATGGEGDGQSNAFELTIPLA